MYLNVLSFKNGKTLGFTSETPFSIDKTSTEWSVVTDVKTGQIFSFKNSEIVTIATAKAPEEPKKETKKRGFKSSVVTE